MSPAIPGWHGLAEVAESDHDEGTGETDSSEAEAEELFVGDGVLSNEGRNLRPSTER